MSEFDTNLKQTLTNIASKQLEYGLEHKRGRVVEARKNEDAYFNKIPKGIKGRINVPVPLMSGYQDTLLSKIDDPPTIKFGHKDIADLKKARLVSGAWQVESGPDKGMWDIKDIIEKKLAVNWGRGIGKVFSESDPKYRSVYSVTDTMDFYCQPRGGWHLKDHRFKGEINVLKTEYDLTKGDRAKLYSQEQVSKLLGAFDENQSSQVKDQMQEKKNRFDSLGLVVDDMEEKSGEKMFALAEHYMIYQGKKYYVLFDPVTMLWIRVEELKDIFEYDEEPYISWATNYDAWNFWSKAPADDVRPIHDMMRVIFNEGIHNLRKRNSGHRAYDSSIFPDPSELEWGIDKLTVAQALDQNKSISQGIYEFQTEDNTGITINLMQFLNSFLAQQTGVNAESQGSSDEKLVGLAFLNIQQAADRFNLYNKFYRQAQTEKGIKYYQGLRENMTEKMMVEIVGPAGTEWDELTRDDLKPKRDFSITISGGRAEAEADALKQKQKADSLTLAVNSYPDKFNPDIIVEEILKNGGWENADVNRLKNVESSGNEEIISEAQKAIDLILKGKEPQPNRGANLAFLKHIMTFVDNTELDPEQIEKLKAYFNAHVEVARKNELKQAGAIADALRAEETRVNVPAGGEGAPSPEDAPPAEAAKALSGGSQSGKIAELITPIR